MSADSDDIIILQHTWTLASKAVQIEFVELAEVQVSPPSSFDAPYAAALRMWSRLSEPQQKHLLTWFKSRMVTNEPLSLIRDDRDSSLEQTVPLIDLGGFVAASTIWKDRFHSYQAFTKWLNGLSKEEVRRRKPSLSRLEVYLPDWVRFWECHDRQHSTTSSTAI
jgi:hypothetical protein